MSMRSNSPEGIRNRKDLVDKVIKKWREANPEKPENKFQKIEVGMVDDDFLRERVTVLARSKYYGTLVLKAYKGGEMHIEQGDSVAIHIPGLRDQILDCDVVVFRPGNMSVAGMTLRKHLVAWT